MCMCVFVLYTCLNCEHLLVCMCVYVRTWMYVNVQYVRSVHSAYVTRFTVPQVRIKTLPPLDTDKVVYEADMWVNCTKRHRLRPVGIASS